jgi:5-methylcytosine-specific restriction endonuclease McrA
MGNAAGAEKTAAKRIGIPLDEYRSRIAAGEKWCHRCTAWRPRAWFAADASRGDGLSAKCSECRERPRWGGPSPRLRALARARDEAWCRDCQDWRPLGEVRRGRCAPHNRAAQVARYASDEAYRRRRIGATMARKRKVAPVPSDGQDLLLEVFEGLCAYCAATADTWDHIVPVSKGGETRPSNIVPCCRSCNSSKHDSDVWEWLERTGRRPRMQFFDRVMLAVGPCGSAPFPGV